MHSIPCIGVPHHMSWNPLNWGTPVFAIACPRVRGGRYLPHIWEDFTYIRRLPMYGKASHIWEVSLYMGGLRIYGEASNMGSLPMYRKSSHIWEDFPFTRRLPRYRETSPTWEIFPYMGSLTVHGQNPRIPMQLTWTQPIC